MSLSSSWSSICFRDAARPRPPLFLKPAGIFGIILIAIGIIALAYGGYTSYTTKENVAKLGPIEINKHEEHPVPIGPIVGGICLVGGIVLVLTGNRKTA